MDQEQVSELLDRYGDDVFRLAMSYLASRQDAEDITQTVFLKLLTLKKPPKPGKEKAFLLTCTANACKNHLKSFWRRSVDRLDESFSFHQPEERALFEAVMKLPGKYRTMIHLYYFEGYDQGEIAQFLHLSRTAVQTRMSRARELLKKELSKNDETI